MSRSFYALVFFSLLSNFELQAQEKDSINFQKRKKKLLIGSSVFYTGTMTGLYFAWYRQSEQTSFQFFDDALQWKQVDKVGHFYSAYHFSLASSEAFIWAGYPEKKARFLGTITGIALMTPIEVFDGFSAEYGFSWTDFLANTTGSLFLYGQYALWNEIRIQPKFSFYRTSFAPQRPNVLGKGIQEEWLKDYNGQTYWLSFDLDKFIQHKKIPPYLNLALGYGAENMIFARDYENQNIGLNPSRQWYLGLDLDLSFIKTESQFLKTFLYFVNMIRLPAPTLEWNTNTGLHWYWIYF